MRKALAIALLAPLALGASAAFAEEVTRPSYKAAVEPICKADTEANEKLLAGVRGEVKQGKLALAGTKFAKAAAALRKAQAQLAAVPQPAADEARLAKWLTYVKGEAALFEAAARALKAGNKQKAQGLVIKLTHNANLANAVVIAFEFHYCKLQPSKFT